MILSERPDARLCSGHAGIYRGPGRSISPTTCLFPGRTGCPAAASIFADDFIGSNRTCTLSAIRFTATAFSSAWSVNNASAEKVELSLRSNGAGPFSYEARATYALDAGALKMWLWVRNVGTETLPFGLGFHPWLVRTPGALLQAKAKRVVLEDNDHLPDGEADVASCVEWDFATPRALPSAGSTTPSSTGTVAQEFFGRSGALSLMSRPIRSSRLISPIRPPPRPTSSVSSQSRIPLMRIICPATRWPMVWRFLRRRRPYRQPVGLALGA